MFMKENNILNLLMKVIADFNPKLSNLILGARTKCNLN